MDDQDSTRTAIRLAVGRRHLSCIEAANAKQARKIIFEQPLSLIICDGVLPGESGLEFIAWLRSEGYEMPVIFIVVPPPELGLIFSGFLS